MVTAPGGAAGRPDMQAATRDVAANAARPRMTDPARDLATKFGGQPRYFGTGRQEFTQWGQLETLREGVRADFLAAAAAAFSFSSAARTVACAARASTS